jgi:ribosomal protein S18 acetylase RimI-like enzyme
MARVMVDTFLAAHKGQVPEEAWQRRRDNWGYDGSQRGWEETLRGIAADADARECVYVACDEAGEVIGVAMGQPAEGFADTGEVNCLYVRQDQHGRGVGRRLVQAVAAHMLQHGLTALHIGVLAANAPARGFYEALGGRVVGEYDIDEYGFTLRGMVYGWPDARTLL